MAESVRFSGALTMRAAPGVLKLVEQAAMARGCKPSEFVRQAVRAELKRDGFDPAIPDKASA